jgi:hypothetical protein
MSSVLVSSAEATEGFKASEVSHDSELNDTWSFWVMTSQGKSSTVKEHWQANQTKTKEISTIADFWRLYNNIHLASRLSSCDYSLFRRGITPAWEDPTCKNGGRLVAKTFSSIDESWMNVQLGLVGEAYTTIAPHVCGAVFSARRGGAKIALWLGTCDKSVIEQATIVFKSCLGIDPGMSHVIRFESFADPSAILPLSNN